MPLLLVVMPLLLAASMHEVESKVPREFRPFARLELQSPETSRSQTRHG